MTWKLKEGKEKLSLTVLCLFYGCITRKTTNDRPVCNIIENMVNGAIKQDMSVSCLQGNAFLFVLNELI